MASPPYGAPIPSTPLALTGARGRVARLIRPYLSGATWLSRGMSPTLPAGGTVIALGGVTSGDAAALAGNTDAALAALRMGAEAGAGRVFVMSSSAVYGRRDGPLQEGMAPTPANPYGRAKAEMEDAVQDWTAKTPGGPGVTILRLGNVAGADALLGGLTDERPRLDVFPDGATPRRNYLSPTALAHVLARLADKAGTLPPILNLGAPDRVAMGDLLRAAGRDWMPVPAPDGALRDVALDTTALGRLVPLPDAMSDPAQIVADWREASA